MMITTAQSGHLRKPPSIGVLLIIGLTAMLLCDCGVAAAGSPPAGRTTELTATETAVRIVTERDGAATRFYVQNDEYCEVTMTVEMRLVNLTGNIGFPYTATFPARTKTEAFEISPIKVDGKWEYSYTNYYKLGSNCARHDDNYVYQLPYAPGNKFKVTQAYNGKFSHTGSNKHAIDWDMPEGTLVHAARGGVVVRVKDDSDKGGASIQYDRYNNYVLIRHDDGTLGHYCHLQKGGCLVKAGQTVAAGDVIAHSGNTGFSSGPHLHFCVFRTRDGRSRESIPIRFRTSQENGITLVSGHVYLAPQIQSASAGTPAG